MDWILECPQCQATAQPDGLPTVCPEGHPWLVRYPDRDHGIVSRARVRRRNGMWRFREFLPIIFRDLQGMLLNEHESLQRARTKAAAAAREKIPSLLDLYSSSDVILDNLFLYTEPKIFRPPTPPPQKTKLMIALKSLHESNKQKSAQNKLQYHLWICTA